MSELSPAAQAVKDAFDSKWAGTRHQALIAALRAAAGHGAAGNTTDEYDTGWRAAMDFIDAIANELEAQ
jgi:hypothetical protein